MKGFTLQRGTAGDGAGVIATNAGIVLEDLVITDNISVTSGQCFGATIRMNGATTPEWHNIRVEDNIAECGEGWGFIYNRDDATTVMENLSVRGNHMASGGYAKGGLASYVGHWEITNAVFAGNTLDHSPNIVFTSEDIRGVVFSLLSGSITMENVTVHGETCSNPAGHIEACIGFADGASTATLSNVSVTSVNASYSTMSASVVWGNGAFSYGNYGSYPSPGFSGDPPSSTLGNISASPNFEDTSSPDPTAWDLRLATGSPLIDAGDPTLTDVDGTTSDIGAYGGLLGDSR